MKLILPISSLHLNTDISMNSKIPSLPLWMGYERWRHGFSIRLPFTWSCRKRQKGKTHPLPRAKGTENIRPFCPRLQKGWGSPPPTKNDAVECRVVTLWLS
ncbi:hypothetical protein AVEN_35259-1 [Araneus ventricosus]|uniref:Uncharacterized protein n=1 Tax=Araneus ventricosus TaxID=182803 RepID=A0A4Y2EFN3_ARAVE|nr:hypothetical protein AVEN_35259-1 [Araneus ventricosus]